MIIDIPGYGDTNLDVLPAVKILDIMGVLRGDYLLLDNRPDRHGMLTVLDKDNNKILKEHPKRVEQCDKNGSMAVQVGIDTFAICPKCADVCSATNEIGHCTVHGDFAIIGKILHKAPKAPPPEKKQQELCNINVLATQCDEMWLNEDVKFDDGKTSVQAISLRIGMRYISFNLYNGSYGKKGNTPPLAALRAGEEVGYQIQKLEHWRKKLRSKGYKETTPINSGANNPT